MRSLILAVLTALGFVAGATDYTWVNRTPTGSGQDWNKVASWKVGEDVATDYPKTTADSADLSLRPANGYQAVALPAGTMGLGVLVGTVQHMLYFGGSTTLTIDNPNGFRGTWQLPVTGNGKSESTVKFDSPATGFVPNLGAVFQDGGSRINIDVATDKTGKIGSLYGSAQIAKTGAGKLAVGEIVGADRSRVTAANGLIEVEGHDPELDGQLPIAGAWVHFDASDTNSYLETETRADGRTYVKKWGDLSGLGHHATKSSNSNVESAPFVNTTRKPNGLNLMDFGSWIDDKSDDKGPSCGVQFAGTTKNHELFIVFEDTSASSKGYFFGDSSNGPSYARDYSGGYIFHVGESKDYVRSGAITLDGERVAEGMRKELGTWDAAADAPRLRVLSVGIDASVVSADSAVSQIASDRAVPRAGGIRVGEFLIYTNTFSHADRLRVVKYLMKKWLPAEMSQKTDIGGLYLKSASAQTVSVPDGQVAQVGEIHATAGAFVKTGTGTLAVDALGTEVKKITVNEGTMSFRPAFAAVADDSQPAASPCAWFDANVSGSVIGGAYPGDEPESRNWVAEWRDCRYDGSTVTLKATSVLKDANYPSLVDGPKAGLKALDFGGYMNLSAAQGKTRDGFIVVRIKGDNSSEINFFGGGHFKRSSGLGTLLWNEEAGRASTSARWYINGVLCDPYDSVNLLNRTDYFVISFSADVNRSVDSFAADGNRNWCGNLQVGEMVLYDRALNETERRQTEAYLMKRWLVGKTPSYTQAAMPELVYPIGEDLVIDADADAAFAKPTGGNGAIVKRGSGEVTLARTYDGEAQSFSVETGSLTLDFGDPIDDAIYHVDASDLDSLVCETEELEGGAVKTNVTKWLDVRRNGKSGNSLKGSGTAKVHPVYTDVEVCPGVIRPAVSLGSFNAADSAAVRFGSASVREIHLVFGDIGGHSGFILGDSGQYPFHRGSSGQLANGASQSPWTGYIDRGLMLLDGQKATRSSAISDFNGHLLMVAPTNGVPFTTLTYDRAVRAGGTWDCEVIAFDHTNTTEVTSYIQKALRYKWFGEGEKPVWTNAVASLSVAEDATLNLRNAPVVSVPNLAGSGTIRLGAAIGVSSLSLDGELTVDGVVVFAPQVRVTYTGAVMPQKGGESVAILTASSLDGFDASGWTLVNPPNPSKRYRFRAVDGTVYLERDRMGLIVIVR